MRILRVWLIVLLCSVLAMPLQASTALHTSQDVLHQGVSTTESIPVSLFVQQKDELQPEAILEVDKVSVAVCHTLILQLYFPGTYFTPLPPGGALAQNSNGMHTILIAGP